MKFIDIFKNLYYISVLSLELIPCWDSLVSLLSNFSANCILVDRGAPDTVSCFMEKHEAFKEAHTLDGKIVQ